MKKRRHEGFLLNYKYKNQLSCEGHVFPHGQSSSEGVFGNIIITGDKKNCSEWHTVNIFVRLHHNILSLYFAADCENLIQYHLIT